jgi:osmotically-inducible protein OsmY
MEKHSFESLPEGDIIRKNVLRELARNSLLKEEEIEVDTEGDEVILLGEIDSRDKKWLAEDIVSDTFGVPHVTNKINVTAGETGKESEGFYEN